MLRQEYSERRENAEWRTAKTETFNFKLILVYLGDRLDHSAIDLICFTGVYCEFYISTQDEGGRTSATSARLASSGWIRNQNDELEIRQLQKFLVKMFLITIINSAISQLGEGGEASDGTFKMPTNCRLDKYIPFVT